MSPTAKTLTTRTVRSKDGTPLACERIGSGPALILVDGALCSRAFGPMPKLAPLLAQRFTVFFYDRRGRGDSGDTKPYARAREVEDLEALIMEAGGAAFVLGLSSGAALALEAAASRLNIAKLALYEPPFMVDQGAHHAAAGHESAAQPDDRGRSPQRRGQVLHEEDGGRPCHLRRPDAFDAVDLAEAGGRGAHAPVRRRSLGRLVAPDRATRVHYDSGPRWPARRPTCGWAERCEPSPMRFRTRSTAR
jgi:pimeloyl-ACP methyl ester carboxylesterase